MSIRAKWLVVGITGGYLFSFVLWGWIVSRMSREMKFSLGIYHYIWPLAIWILLLFACFAWGTRAQKIAAASPSAAVRQNQILRYAFRISATLILLDLWTIVSFFV